jgi:putative hydrolase of the HAD superfamily
MKNLLNIKYWLFDLDNTLYSGQTKVFSEVDKKMSSFISKKFNVDLIKAREIQKEYFYEYGTTLSGLMNHDKIDPHEFLEFVHDIDISWLPKDELLREELIKIKEKKYIFTNGSHAHVENVTKQLGIDGLFDGTFVEKFDLDSTKSILIEDIAHNLEQAKNLGMKTCWLENDEAFAKKDAHKPYIDYKIKILPSFLQKINILKAQ